jgi:VIT1/CCC1 family predicted Fe2+/Mn2+ transporter
MPSKKHLAGHLRNFIFGAEDSLVSTVGLVSGIAVAGVPREDILLTGIILIFVEAFSMGVGSFLSERSAEEYMKDEGMPTSYTLENSAIMFFSYFVSGFIPIIPYLIFDIGSAFIFSIIASFIALFGLGAIGAKMFHSNIFRSGMRMLLIGGAAICIGVLVGRLIK